MQRKWKSVLLFFAFLFGTIPCIFVMGQNQSPQLQEIEMVLSNVKEINTVGDDFYPSITADGSTMVFGMKPRDSEHSDIYIS
ncbi:MAG: hypothetical protein N2316_02185, partial [Spirochaetes bacterium]|nr:hypothetical protein [Spirochaetota bacterium]